MLPLTYIPTRIELLAKLARFLFLPKLIFSLAEGIFKYVWMLANTWLGYGNLFVTHFPDYWKKICLATPTDIATDTHKCTSMYVCKYVYILLYHCQLRITHSTKKERKQHAHITFVSLLANWLADWLFCEFANRWVWLFVTK